MKSADLTDGFATNHDFDSDFFGWRDVHGDSFILVSRATQTRYGFMVKPGGVVAGGPVPVIHCFTNDMPLPRDDWNLMTLHSENGKVVARPGWE